MKEINKKDQRGVTILISVLILSSIVILALAVADIVGRSHRTSKNIGLSEVAYFAAEKGIEGALYTIEKNRSIQGLDGATGQLGTITSATWSREIDVLDDAEATDMDCLTLELPTTSRGLCVDSSQPNQPKIKVKLPPSYSFQLELDFLGLESFIPNALQIDGVNEDNASTTIFDVATGVMTAPEHLNHVSLLDQKPILKITNQSAETKIVEINSNDSGHVDVLLSLLITSTGTYQDQKRVIEVQRRNWQIY